MTRYPMRSWLVLGACGAVVAAGCGRSARECSSCVPGPYQSYTYVTSSAPVAPAPAAATPPVKAAEPVQAAPSAFQIPETVTPHTTLKVETPSSESTSEKLKRRTFGDITAKEQFAHADDHSWLVGEVHFDRKRQAWRLRYASVDEIDRFGGSVTLDCTRLLSEAKDGDLVRVEGSVVDAEASDPAPTYHVKTVNVVKQVASGQ